MFQNPGNQILTHVDDNSSRVELNDRVYENIKHYNDITSTAKKEKKSYGKNWDPVQNTHNSRMYSTLHQREQNRLIRLERHISRQQNETKQLQQFVIDKYKQRLEDYNKKRASPRQSISPTRRQNSISGKPLNDSTSKGDKAGLRASDRRLYVNSSGFDQSFNYFKAKRQSVQSEGITAECEVLPTQTAPSKKTRNYLTVVNHEKEKRDSKYSKTLKVSISNINEVPSYGKLDVTTKIPIKSHNCEIESESFVKCHTRSFKSDLIVTETIRKFSKSRFLKEDSTIMATGGYNPERNFLQVDEMRPRSNSDSRITTPKSTGVKLPEIKVEDFSDCKLQFRQCLPGRSNPESGDRDTFFSSVGRRRSYTCPEDLFRPNRDRPPTPPPKDGLPALKNMCRNTSRERVSFTHHVLGKVSEDNNESRPDSTTSTDNVSSDVLQKLFRNDDASKRTAGLSES